MKTLPSDKTANAREIPASLGRENTPSHLAEFARVERREKERKDSEAATLTKAEADLESSLATELAEKEKEISEEGRDALRTFKKEDIAPFVRDGEEKIERDTAAEHERALKKREEAVASLVSAATSDAFLSRL